ncbi:uncharacterized protein L969DRAFT_284974 [Mixia osmundae IAM 14324]|uniref:Bromo domain-containing protein n=1 Tax=Mixia osmundae (strain CBS 9802 / IAM 14324 / JCM 22182 / KY 12970) TaxID=764103 RepID=G7DWP9_MIXOS|nr:uncharacterized protein L969DRAFT_284974 [Mixia osmundae IAM 14324]KEI36225.1 hypothetical protein L969DRAFT_284974 [Mixia osmundae IAM 14324]GAA94996.1 hypothetical protein E5Q_01651 [Mixia osmundae IAM 14324]
MKYLLEAIDNYSRSHGRGARSAYELKQLVAEARDGVDDKTSSQEFYETLERIVNELRAWTEHSTPFLQRVRKAEAPDYYNVIKKPMDLGTILKKVKGQQYKDKQAFADDLNLIWNNCLLYNSLPTHPLRRSAQLLRQKSNQLLEFISDNTPAANARLVDEDAEGESEDGDEDDTIATRKGLGSRKGADGQAETGAKTLETASASTGTPAEVRDGTPSVSGQDNLLHARNRPRQSLNKRKLGRAELPFEEKPAVVRTPESMSRFQSYYLGSSAVETSQAASSTAMRPTASTSSVTLDTYAVDMKNEAIARVQSITAGPEDVDRFYWEQMAADAFTTSSIPELPFVNSIAPEEISPRKHQKTRSVEPTTGLEAHLDRNLSTLKHVKNLHRQIVTQSIHSSVDQEGLDDSKDDDFMQIDEPAYINDVPRLDILESALTPAIDIAVLRKICAKMLSHAGFDGCAASALDMLMSVIIEYMNNVGRTLRLFCDRYGRALSPLSILGQVMRTNGIASSAALEEYISEDLIKQGGRMLELQKKLEQARNDMLNEPREQCVDDTDMLAGDGEAIAMGQYAAELGEDFFGLKELGLDQELGMSSFKIPKRLFTGEKKPVIMKKEEAEHVNGDAEEDDEPVPFVPLTADAIELQIGLMQPVYRARLRTELKLIDDAASDVRFKPMRPKVPSTGRIPQKRRDQAFPTPAKTAAKLAALNGDASLIEELSD